MSASSRLKIVREDLGVSQKAMAKLLNLSYRTYQNYEDGVNNPGWDACEALARLGFDANWLLTGSGSMRREEQALSAAGNGFLQGQRVEADEIHIYNGGTARESVPGYVDPVTQAFLNDYLRLSKAEQLRLWAVVKEKLEE